LYRGSIARSIAAACCRMAIFMRRRSLTRNFTPSVAAFGRSCRATSSVRETVPSLRPDFFSAPSMRRTSSGVTSSRALLPRCGMTRFSALFAISTEFASRSA
jgi:hypothetical protein